MSNQYFDNYNNIAEQSLIEDLIVESLSIYSHDCFYIPRTVINQDEILNEYQTYKFEDALQFEVYIKNFYSFSGQDIFLSKFGVETRDEITFTISIRNFINFIGSNLQTTRPREGDLIFLPMTKAVYQIKYAKEDAVFYQLGKVYTYDLNCELFEYSNELFETGIDELDTKYNALRNDILSRNIENENSEYLDNEYAQELIDSLFDIEELDPNAQNDSIQKDSDEIINFDIKNPFGEDP